MVRKPLCVSIASLLIALTGAACDEDLPPVPANIEELPAAVVRPNLDDLRYARPSPKERKDAPAQRLQAQYTSTPTITPPATPPPMA
jgi:hypothetical protein